MKPKHVSYAPFLLLLDAVLSVVLATSTVPVEAFAEAVSEMGLADSAVTDVSVEPVDNPSEPGDAIVPVDMQASLDVVWDGCGVGDTVIDTVPADGSDLDVRASVPAVGEGVSLVSWSTTPDGTDEMGVDSSGAAVVVRRAVSVPLDAVLHGTSLETFVTRVNLDGNLVSESVTYDLSEFVVDGQLVLYAQYVRPGPSSGEESSDAPSVPAATSFSYDLEAVCDEVTVRAHVTVPTALPDGATLACRFLGEDVEREGSDFLVHRSMDLSVLDAGGNEVELAEGSEVKVSFSFAKPLLGASDVLVVHGDGDDAEMLAADVDGNGVVSTVSDGFSPYTVEFTYDGLTYVVEGDAHVRLSEVLTSVGIQGVPASVEDVSVSDPELFGVREESGELWFVSYKPFKTDEWMRLRIGDVDHFVRVTDATFVDGGSFGLSGYWWLDSDGVLRLRPLSSMPTAIITKSMMEAGVPWAAHKNKIRSVIVSGTVEVDSSASLSKMFMGYANLVSADLTGLDLSSATNLNAMFQDCVNLRFVTFGDYGTDELQDVSSMFRNCRSLESLDLSSWTNSGKMYNMGRMCLGCSSLRSFKLNNPRFVTRTNDGCRIVDMLRDCSSLVEVDMSNVTIGGRLDGADGFAMMFADKANLVSVNLSNARFPDMQSFNSAFQGCTKLVTCNLSGIDVSDAVSMDRMFKNCSSLKELDLSSFGKLSKVVDMYNMFLGCSSLETLNIDNLDNSSISDTPAYGDEVLYREVDGRVIQNDSPDSQRRDLGLTSCKALRTLSARDSKVWICDDKTSVYGAYPYWEVSDGTSYVKLMENSMYYSPDVAPGDSILLNLREWCDLVSDRYDEGARDFSTNPNARYGGHTNTNGAGFLSPGVYTDTDDTIDYYGELPVSTYWADAFATSTPVLEVEVDGRWVTPTDGREVSVGNYLVSKSGGSYDVYTCYRTFDEWGSGDVTYGGGKLRVTFPDAATGPDGTRHDIVILVNDVEFKDVDLVPSADTYERRENDVNNVASTEYARQILSAGTGVLELKNYVIDGALRGSWSAEQRKALSRGSGTYIDYTLSIDGAQPGETYIFWGRDLDVMHAQDWILDESDARFDMLPLGNVTYGAGSEGIQLLDGNDLDTLTFANHSGLELIDGNYVVPTGSDPMTDWSSFFVRGSATGSDYVWTSGIACTSRLILHSGGDERLSKLVIEKETLSGTDTKFSFEGRIEDGNGNLVQTLSFELGDGELYEVDGIRRGWVLVLDELDKNGWTCVSGSHVEEVLGGLDDTHVTFRNALDMQVPLMFGKADAESGELLSGASMSIVGATDNVPVASWVSSANGFYVTSLPDGEYILREVSPPVGYGSASDIRFRVVGGLVGGVDDTVVMRDDRLSCPVTLEKRSLMGDGTFTFEVRAAVDGEDLDLSYIDGATYDASSRIWRVPVTTVGGHGSVELFSLPYGAEYYISEVQDDEDWSLVSVDGNTKATRVFNPSVKAAARHVFVNRNVFINMPSAGGDVAWQPFVGLVAVLGGLVLCRRRKVRG